MNERISRAREIVAEAVVEMQHEFNAAQGEYERAYEYFESFLSVGNMAECEKLYPGVEQKRDVMQGLQYALDDLNQAVDHLDRVPEREPVVA